MAAKGRKKTITALTAVQPDMFVSVHDGNHDHLCRLFLRAVRFEILTFYLHYVCGTFFPTRSVTLPNHLITGVTWELCDKLLATVGSASFPGLPPQNLSLAGEHITGHWVDVWKSGGVASAFCTAVGWLSEPEKHCRDCQILTLSHSVVSGCDW